MYAIKIRRGIFIIFQRRWVDKSMEELKQRIIKDGRLKEGNILKVDNFLNHQMDIALFNAMGKEFYRLALLVVFQQFLQSVKQRFHAHAVQIQRILLKGLFFRQLKIAFRRAFFHLLQDKRRLFNLFIFLQLQNQQRLRVVLFRRFRLWQQAAGFDV